MPEPRHACPAECGRTVGYAMFACRDDWNRLPGEHKQAILQTYRRRKTNPAAHRAAMLAATNWYRDHPTRSEARRG